MHSHGKYYHQQTIFHIWMLLWAWYGEKCTNLNAGKLCTQVQNISLFHFVKQQLWESSGLLDSETGHRLLGFLNIMAFFYSLLTDFKDPENVFSQLASYSDRWGPTWLTWSNIFCQSWNNFGISQEISILFFSLLSDFKGYFFPCKTQSFWVA